MNRRPASRPNCPLHPRLSLRRVRSRFALSIIAFSVGASFLSSHSAVAATRTWNNAAGGDFNTPANWTGGIPVSGDTGLFNTALTGNITLSANAAPGSINFDLAADNSTTHNLTIGVNGGNTLTFANGGNLSVLGTLTGTGKTFTIAAPVVLTPASATTAGAFTIQNDATSSTNTLVVSGGISSSTTSNTETLTLAGSNSGNNTISGNITKGTATTFAVSKSGAGTWILSGTGNNYNGATAISAGTLSLTGSLTGGTAISTAGTGVLTESSTGSITGAASITLAGTGTSSLAGTANSYTGATTIGTGTTLNLTGSLTGATAINNSGTFTESGAGVIGSAAATLVNSAGTTTLSGINTYTGATSVNGGTLLLDFSQATAPTTATNIIKSTNTVNLGGGSLVLKGGGAGATNSQTFGTTALTANTFSTITVNSNGGTALNLALGSLSRGAQSAFDITLPAAGTVTTTAGGATASQKNGILVNSNSVAYATANGGTSWLSEATTPANGPYALTAYAGYVNGNANYTSNNNVDVTNGDSVSGVTVNTLRFNAATDALTLAGTNTVSTGGILITPNATAASITGGTLQAGTSGKELVIIDYGALNVNSVIADNATASLLTLGGTGTTTLSVANTFTGQTSVNSGTLKLANQNALQTSALQVSAGASLLFDQVNSFTIPSLNGAGNVVLQNNTTTAPIALTVSGTASTTFSGVLSGSGSLIKTGTGVLTLSGTSSTYTGTTTVTGGGSISIASDASLGAAPATLVADQLTLDNGTLLIPNIFNTANTRGITLGAGGGTINVNNTNNAGIGGVITGPGSLTVITSVASGRILALSGANTFAGGVFVTSGSQLSAQSSTALGTGTLTLGTANSSANPFFRTNNTVNIANDITVTAGGTRTIGADSGNTTATLSGPITLVGGTTNPTLNFQSTQSGSTLIVSGGITGTGNVAFAGDINNRSNTNTTISGTSINNIGTISNLAANNTGTDTISAVIGANVTGLIQNSTKQNLVLSGNNSGANFFGDTTLTTGTINVQNANALANSVVNTNATAGALTFGSGATNITTAQIGGLNGTGSATAGSFGNINLVNSGAGAGALALSIGNSNVANGSVANPNSLNPVYSGIISGAGSIIKTDSNTQTLTGNNTYTGGTSINGGTLLINNASGSGTGTGAVAVGNGILTATLGGAGTISGGVTVNTGSLLSPGVTAAQGSIGTLTVGALTLTPSSTLAFDITSTSSKDLIQLTTGSLTLGGTLALNLPNVSSTGIDYGQLYTIASGVTGVTGAFSNVTGFDNTDYNANFTLDGTNYDLSFTAVPEPSTWIGGIACLGFLGYHLVRSRRVARREATTLA